LVENLCLKLKVKWSELMNLSRLHPVSSTAKA